MRPRAPTVRPPAVAGLFYPGDRRQLHSLVHEYLAAAACPSEALPKAVIVPHAGYVYSGPVAAAAYVRLRPGRGVVRRVVLLGPSHHVPFRGLAVPATEAFATPLGEVPVDRQAVERILALPSVREFDGAHADEHSLEVQLPFLQEVLEEQPGDFALVPIAAGSAPPEEVASVIEALWDGAETLFVVSSDLSHYHDYETARRLDAATCRAIEAMRPEDIGEEDACGRVPVRGLLLAARRHGLRARTLDLRNSGDTAGPRDRVVGYGAWALA